MTDLHQAARRAAEAIVYDVMENPKPGNVEKACDTIAAEFAPLLAEACGLLERAREAIRNDDSDLDDEVFAFLAKHKEQSNG